MVEDCGTTGQTTAFKQSYCRSEGYAASDVITALRCERSDPEDAHRAPPYKELSMLRRMLWHVLVLGFFFGAPGLPANAAEAYQVSTISSLLAGGYDGTTTVGQMLRHGNFGLGTFSGVDGEMMVLDGRVYRATTDGRAHLVASTELTPLAAVVPFRPQTSMPVGTGQSLDRFEVALDALPYSASRVLAVRVDGRFPTVQIRSEPKQSPPYRSLAEVIKTQQVVHTLNDVQGTLIEISDLRIGFPPALPHLPPATNRSRR
jgi:acetolactate decarboxylase